MNLTREQAIAEHRKMWNWIADKTIRRKRKVKKIEYLRRGIKRINLLNDCFLCEYCYNCSDRSCSNCPVDWGATSKGNYQCEVMNTGNGTDGYYAKWRESIDWEESARLARIIANLPERREQSE